MTAIAINYIANPFATMCSSINRAFMIAGYARAASELTRMGYIEAAQNCIKQGAELKAK